MTSSLISIALQILAFLAIVSGILSIIAAAMLSSRISRQEEEHMTDQPNPVQDYARRVEIFNAIRRERAYQDRKYGTIAQRNLLLDNYLGICRAELTEAWDALANGDRDNARCELLQVAAVAIAALEAHGLVERDQLNTTGA